MKKFTTIAFAALVAVTLSMPVWAQTAPAANSQTKPAAQQPKDEKKAAKAKKQDKKTKKAAKDAKKNSTNTTK